MTKALIFDCFDVLVTNGLPLFLNTYLLNEPEKQAQVMALEDSLNAGTYSYEVFLQKAAELGNASLEETRCILDDNQPDEALFAYISDVLKPQYKIGMLSNAGDDWLDEMIGVEKRTLFDAIVLSYQVGYVKPQPEMYQLVAHKLGVPPNQCVMIDDRERYCKGAQAVGMQAILYQSFEQMKRELEAKLSNKRTVEA